MLIAFIITMYVAIIGLFIRDFRKGLVVHSANLAYFKWYVLPRFTVREPNGRFKANKVGMFYVATH